MKSFNFNRFCQMFRWYFQINVNNLLAWTLGCAIGAWLGELLFFSFFSKGSYASLVGSAATFCHIFLIIAVFVAFSTYLSSEKDKLRRSAFLMVPATSLEKWLAALLHVTVVWAGCVYLAFMLGDTLRMVTLSVFFDKPWVSAVPEVLRTGFVRFIAEGRPQAAVSSALALVWLHSYYILGGTLLRRYAFVICTALIMLGISAFGFIMSKYDNSLVALSYYINVFTYVVDLILLGLIAFNYWASYNIFKNYELISNKWTNYDILKR